MAITALGVTVLTGIYAACQDMYRSADLFYDEQNLFDIRIVSTLGLTEEDVQALAGLSGVEKATGAYSETVRTDIEGLAKDAEVVVLAENGMNQPYLMEGTLPAQAGQIAVTQRYLDDSGKAVGDSIVFEEKMDDDEGEEENPGEEEANAAEEDSAEGGERGSDADAESEEDATEVDWDTEVEIENEEEPNFIRDTFTITGVVLDPMDIGNGSLAFRAGGGADYRFFITAEDAVYDVYTAVYVGVQGLRQMNCYSDEYESAVQAVVDTIESEIMRQREEARYQAVLSEAVATIADAEETMDEKFAEADEQFADAWQEIEDAKKELLDGEAELTEEERDALQQLADARMQLAGAQAQLGDATEQMSIARQQLEENAQTLADGKIELAAQREAAEQQFAETEAKLAEGQRRLDADAQQLAPLVDGVLGLFGAASLPAAEWQALVAAAAAKTGQLLAQNPEASPDAAVVAAATTDAQNALAAQLVPVIVGWGSPDYSTQQQIDALVGQCISAALGQGMLNGAQGALDAQQAAFEQGRAAARQLFTEKEAEIAAGEAQIEAGRQQLAEGEEQLRQGWEALAVGVDELNREEKEALEKLADAWRELADGKRELAEGEAELIENEQQYEEKREEAERKLADAWQELEDIEMTTWYVQDSSALDSYASMKGDLSSIEAVGRAFPVVFLVVAILISLTTMTRMVEEERGLIGTYKALGFGDGAIYTKYLFYALMACLIGGLLGDILGFVVLPLFLINILQVLYTLPHIVLGFNLVYGVGGVLLFMVCMLASTGIACRKELRQMPSQLMRPKAPRAGARIALERIPPVWNRLRFLNKVTARNLFRYKKRLFMTLLGIAGCTALVLCGFAIRDSVTELMPKQYERTYKYDLMVVTAADDNEEWLAQVQAEAAIEHHLNLQVESAKLMEEGGKGETVQLMVVPEGESIEEYIGLVDTGDNPVQLGARDVFVTQNAAELLNLQPESKITLQNLQLDRAQTTVTQVVRNYLGNHVYIGQQLYEELFGEYKPNAILADLTLPEGQQAAYAESLLENDMVITAISIEAQREDFSSNFALLNAVMSLLIVLAAGLAFVVLFTLSNTNISERVRELATIKVLGFFNREVHSYVNKETLLLTAMGIVIGLPVGRFVSSLLTAALKMPSLYFAVYVKPSSYLAAAVISFCFALVVNVITNRTLDKINMVEALKSVE